MGWVIFPGNIDSLQGKKPFGDGDCVDLVQAVTSIGHTSKWMRGPRVLDLLYLNPGTVIANFIQAPDGRWVFPNQHGYHAGFFVEFGPANLPVEKPTGFWCMDQFQHRKINEVGERRILSQGVATSEQGNPVQDCNNAEHYYVVEIL